MYSKVNYYSNREEAVNLPNTAFNCFLPLKNKNEQKTTE